MEQETGLWEIFNAYCSKYKLFSPNDKVLLAVSGGIDSMVMADLFLESGIATGVAHCNFRLRGKESDQDEKFVSEYAENNNIPFFSESFETEDYAEENNISTQMAARELRYRWFEKIRATKGFNLIALAHNKNDTIETVLLNIARGTGLKGLTGINRKSGYVIRPLLFATRNEIAEYADKNSVSYREDSSNIQTKYKRNLVRHNIIPEFEALNPDFVGSFSQSVSQIEEAYEIYQKLISLQKENVLTEIGDKILIDIKKLTGLANKGTYLYEFLKPYNFSSQIVGDIIESLDGISGKKFHSPTHRIIKDRDHLIITTQKEKTKKRYYIDEQVEKLTDPVVLSFRKFTLAPDDKIPASRKTAWIDASVLEYPLLLRKWQSGDYFFPLGMQDPKKVSDFFIDEKLSIVEKESSWILFSGDKIVWILGKRLDDRFRVIDETKEVLEIKIG